MLSASRGNTIITTINDKRYMRKLTIRNIGEIRNIPLIASSPFIHQVIEWDDEYRLLAVWGGREWAVSLNRQGDRTGWTMRVSLLAKPGHTDWPLWVEPVTMGDVTRPNVLLKTIESTFVKVFELIKP